MSRPMLRPWLLLGAGLLLLTAAVVLHVLVVRDAKPQLWSMIDLRVYRWGGLQARAGHGTYDGRLDGYLPFTYPPIAAVLFMPAATLAFSDLMLLLSTLTVTALVATVAIAWRAAGRTRNVERAAGRTRNVERAAGRTRIVEGAGLAMLVAAAALWLEPVQQTLRFGQVNVLLMLIVVADLLRGDAHRTKGVGVGVAAGIKLTPAIFVVYLLVTGRVRAALVALGAFAATVFVGFAVLPADSWQFWIDRVFLDSSRVGGVAYVGNQSIHGLLARLAGGDHGADPWWLLLALPVAAVGLWLARQWSRHGDELGAVLLTATTALLVSPISWSHHWVWLAPALVWSIDRAVRRPTWRTWGLPLTLVLLAAAWPFRAANAPRTLPNGLLWRVPFEQGRELHWSPAQFVVGDLYVLGALAVLGAALWHERAAFALSVRRSRGTIRRGAPRAAPRPRRSTPPTPAADLRGSSGR